MNLTNNEPDPEFARLPALSRCDALFFAAAFLFIYTQLFQFPFTPIYFEGDNLFSVSNAMRMLDGEVMYRDFFHLTPPGTELIYEALFTIFGIKIWVLNLVILFLGIAQIWLLWFFSRQTLRGILVYLPSAMMLVVGFRFFGTDGSYRLFSVNFVLLAVAILFNKRSPRNIMIAGALCGLASFFVQTRGIVGIAGICFFLLWENYARGFDLKSLLRSGLLIGIPFLFVIAATHSYFVWQAGFDNYYFALVEFLQKHYKNDPLAGMASYFTDVSDFQSFLKEYSTLGAISRYTRVVGPVLFYYLLIPLVYVAFLVYRSVSKMPRVDRQVDSRLMLLCCVGVTLAIGLSGPTAARLNHVAIPGMVLLIWLFSQIPFSKRIGMALTAVLVLVGTSYIFQRQIIVKKYLDMPAGRAAFLSPEAFERYKWIGENTSEGEILYEAQHPSFYFPFHLKNPTPMVIVRDSEYTPRFQVDSVVNALAKNPPNIIVWDGKWSKAAEARAVGDNLEPLWEYIESNYELSVEYAVHGDYTVTSERQIQFWRRKN